MKLTFLEMDTSYQCLMDDILSESWIVRYDDLMSNGLLCWHSKSRTVRHDDFIGRELSGVSRERWACHSNKNSWILEINASLVNVRSTFLIGPLSRLIFPLPFHPFNATWFSIMVFTCMMVFGFRTPFRIPRCHCFCCLSNSAQSTN